ncbi:hypothetical protein P5673_016590 [Acropora cervicornis]|uniref:Uncharacterized protein n=1 Tax=Acropora cervicornis TaxID=6130 RepID=A0AAD9QGB2_ACRCE|nr:hypothetical protein P5673_016590 [Acropora cervicornis]
MSHKEDSAQESSSSTESSSEESVYEDETLRSIQPDSSDEDMVPYADDPYPAKDRLTQTADHYIEAKRPFELSSSQRDPFNTLVDVITSKIPPDDADKPWIWLQKIKDHYVGASTLMQDRYHFWVQMAQADQTSISAWETAVSTAAGRCSFRSNAHEFIRDKFLFGLNESFSRFREHIFYRDRQRKPENPPFTLAFVRLMGKCTRSTIPLSGELLRPSIADPPTVSSEINHRKIASKLITTSIHRLL